MNKKKAIKWVEALRSGEFKQAKGVLEGRKGFCCLGVACKLFIPANKLEFDTNLDDDDGTEYLLGGMPEEQPHAPAWLKKLNHNFERRTGGVDFTRLNDGYKSGGPRLNKLGRFNFDEIADMIQLVYLEGAFD